MSWSGFALDGCDRGRMGFLGSERQNVLKRAKATRNGAGAQVVRRARSRHASGVNRYGIASKGSAVGTPSRSSRLIRAARRDRRGPETAWRASRTQHRSPDARSAARLRACISMLPRWRPPRRLSRCTRDRGTRRFAVHLYFVFGWPPGIDVLEGLATRLGFPDADEDCRIECSFALLLERGRPPRSSPASALRSTPLLARARSRDAAALPGSTGGLMG